MRISVGPGETFSDLDWIPNGPLTLLDSPDGPKYLGHEVDIYESFVKYLDSQRRSSNRWYRLRIHIWCFQDPVRSLSCWPVLFEVVSAELKMLAILISGVMCRGHGPSVLCVYAVSTYPSVYAFISIFLLASGELFNVLKNSTSDAFAGSVSRSRHVLL